MSEIMVAILITMTASAIQGVAGFGGGLISMGLLSILWSVPTATAVLCPLGLALNATVMWRLRAHLKPRLVRPILIGLPWGVGVGVLCLERLPEELLRQALGIALSAAVINALWGRPLGALPRFIAYLMGVLSGFTGAALSSPGPPVIIYATLCGWPRDTFRAQLSIIFFTAGALSLVGLSLNGVIDQQTLLISALLLPGLIIASWLGLKLGDRLPQAQFQRVVLCLLTALAVRFL